jgi:F0F1-type ATP synthase assembly protein I
MTNNAPDGRSPIAMAMQWASQVTTISIEMVAPILLGVWADRSWGTKSVFTILGSIAGLWLGIWSLIRMTQGMGESTKKDNARQGKINGNKES